MSWGIEENEEVKVEQVAKPIIKITEITELKEMIKKEGMKKAQKQEEKIIKEINKYNFNDTTKIRNNLNYLLYGRSGSGKTYSSFTFPEPIIIIDTENRSEMTHKMCFKDKKVFIYRPKEVLEAVGSKGEVIDFKKSIDNLSNFILQLIKDIREKKVEVKTVIVDSASDLWWWCANWGMLILADKINKDGSRKADPYMLQIKNQFNWYLPTNKHYNIVEILKKLNDYGVNIVFTARIKTVPDYVKKDKKKTMNVEAFEERIKCQKALPYSCDVVVRQVLTQENKRLSIIEKWYDESAKDKIIENLTFDKLKKELKLGDDKK